MMNDARTEKFFINNELLARCKNTIEVYIIQELHEEIDIQKNLRKEVDIKTEYMKHKSLNYKSLSLILMKI